MTFEHLTHSDEMLEIHRLHQIRIGSQLVGQIYKTGLVCSSEHHHTQTAQARLLSNPLQDLQAILVRHLEVQQQQIRQRIFSAIGVLTLSLEILDRLFAIGDDVKWIEKIRFGESPAGQQNIYFIVFRQQNDCLITHESNPRNTQHTGVREYSLTGFAQLPSSFPAPADCKW